MAYDPEFGEWVREHLAALGPLEIKRMFGAGAVYANGTIFALLDDGVIWLKADEVNAPLLTAAGARQFTYPTKEGAMTMAYWSLPERALDDPDEAVDWARQSIDAALRKAAAKKPRKPKVKP
ncbi:DNA transformation protein [Brevundimonas alba]|uniref:DNA transformation protein n=1 Tax=Brevundimonas alba TaxID=74314 RepID=A0A7X5YP99_9CAUL|nr:TfoX/Sxy family protein [Brevundimonas alba]NJC42220.1 DNA transformation protein [Brevundimonas alba]